LFHLVARELYCFTKAARSAIALASAAALSALSVVISALRLSKIPCIAVICATNAARVAFVLEEEFDTFAVADTATCPAKGSEVPPVAEIVTVFSVNGINTLYDLTVSVSVVTDVAVRISEPEPNA